MLELLSGQEHHVYSGLCLWPLEGGRPQVEVARTTLRMDHLATAQLDEYLSSGLWEGKAGAFGYQDRAGWLHVVEGSESNVIGLPLELLAEMLAQAGWPGPTHPEKP
jgi:septum formation protein